MTCAIGLVGVRYNTISTASQITIHYTFDSTTDCHIPM